MNLSKKHSFSGIYDFNETKDIFDLQDEMLFLFFKLTA